MSTFKRSPIVWRIVLYFFIASLTVSIIAAVAILTFRHQQQIQVIEQRFELLKTSYADSLGTSLWFYDENQLAAQIKGLANISELQYVRVTDNLSFNLESGIRPHSSHIQSIVLTYNGRKVGLLEIAFDNEGIIKKSLQSAINTLIAQLLSLILLALILGLIVHHFFIRRITHLAEEVEQRRESKSFAPLSLALNDQNDEITSLIQAFKIGRAHV